MSLDQLLDDLAVGCRIIAMEGHSDVVWGHMSVRDPENAERFWMKGTGLGLEEVTPDDMVLVDLEGKKLSGKRRRHSEYPIHSEIYRARPDINAVIHTHPQYCTIMASMDADMVSCDHESALFVPPPIPRFHSTTDIIRTVEQGRSLAQQLGKHRAVLMRNHGVAIAGISIAEATMLAIFLEKACHSQLIAMAAGSFRPTPESEAAQIQKSLFYPERALRVWDYYARKVTRW